MDATLPATIGNFKIIAKLGQGGMGAVYRAMHGTLERPVALKVLPVEFAVHAEYVSRFLREARTIATLRHENVVQVYDAGEDNGQYYIAMELVDGSNLLKICEEKNQKISEKEALDWMLQAARGLAAAHKKGLVHRDIKPENLLLGHDNILRIVDFGLVMDSKSASQLTMAGTFLGTPMYMSPEQVDGEIADHRTDIYSLGITFFRVFTGQPPFNGTTVMNLLYKQKFEAPPDPRVLRSDLSVEIRNLLLYMIAKKREERPPTAQAVVDVIENIRKTQGGTATRRALDTAAQSESADDALASGRPVLNKSGRIVMLPEDEFHAQTEKLAEEPPVSKMKYVIGGIAAAVLVVAVIIGILIFSAPEPPKDPPKVSLPAMAIGQTDERLAQADAAFSAQRYSYALSVYKELLAKSPNNDDLKKKIERTENILRFSALMKEAEALETKGMYDAAAAKLGDALLLDDDSAAKDTLKRVIAKSAEQRDAQRSAERTKYIAQAEDAVRKGDMPTAAQNYTRAAELSDGVTKEQYAQYARDMERQYLLDRGKVFEEKGNLKDALTTYLRAQNLGDDPATTRKVEVLQTKIKDIESKNEFDTLFKTGLALMRTDLAGAKTKFLAAQQIKDSVELQRKLDEVAGRELMALGDAEREKKNYEQAKNYYQEAVRKCYLLLPDAKERIENLKESKSVAPEVIGKVDFFIDAKKDASAMKEVEDGLQKEPGNAALQTVRAGLDNLQAWTVVYNETTRIANGGAAAIAAGMSIENEEKGQSYKESVEAVKVKISDAFGKVRPALLAHNYIGVKAALQMARTDAGDLANTLNAAAVYFAGFKKKPERYQGIVDTLKRMADQARNLQR